MPENNLKLADEFAPDYDKSVLPNNWNGPKILFQLCEKYLNKSDNLLDLGIGTGESSRLFQNYGCKITGLDGSEKMLEQCKQKNIGHSLVLHNLEIVPFPFNSNLFHWVLSQGVFHLIHPIQPIFCEVKRLLQPNGFFAFTFENEDTISNSNEIEPGIWETITESGVYTYKHSGNLITELLGKQKFTVLHRQKFLAFTHPQLQTNTYFTAVLAQVQ